MQKVYIKSMLAFFIFFMGVRVLYSQQHNFALNDTNKVDTLISQSRKSAFKSNYKEAFILAYEAKTLAEKLNFKKGIAKTYTTIGIIHNIQGNYPEALKNYFASLKLFEEIGSKKGISYSYNNIGMVYDEQANYPEALKNHLASLRIKKEIGDKGSIPSSYNNIANIYAKQGNYSEALKNYFTALKKYEEMGNKEGIAASYNNIGNVCADESNYQEALKNHFASLKIYEDMNDKEGCIQPFLNIGANYRDLKNYKEAEEYCKKALNLAKEIGDLESIKNASQTLSDVYAATDRQGLALQSYKAYIAARDSLNNEENTKKTVQLSMQYEFDKKEAATKLEQQAKDKIQTAEAQKQRIALLLGSCVLLLVVVFAFIMFNRFKVTHKQKIIIEEKNKEITDSINYAERIQRSFLATKELLDENLKEYFVFFQPKDIVSGDFYWAGKLNNNNFALATADSTGHGVPGAIMSILNISSLEKAVEQGLTQPAEILNHTRLNIIERLKKDGSTEGGKDGMDCSLVCFDFANSKLTYSAANNPIWIVREKILLEFAPDKMPVGKHDKDNLSFTQHSIDLQKGDVIYTLTDGMPDQFGGAKGKKFMYKQLKALLISIAHLPMQKQKETLVENFSTWKGGLEQIDDVCIIGIKFG
ncbi:MAG: tetratricopeptide repeat protein [Bacteroidia bacterium]